MQRRKFFHTAALSAAALPLAGQGRSLFQSDSREYYEWRVYELAGGGGRRRFVQYLEDAYVPALKKHGARAVGVFEEIAMPEPPTVYLLIAYPSLADFEEMPLRILGDPAYQAASSQYEAIQPDSKAYFRYHTSLLQAFTSIPRMEIPPDSHELFELRTYESFSGEAARRKVAMFDNGELDIFKRVGLHPVFFGSMLAGPDMPALTYMLSFEDMTQRDENWNQFVNHPDWRSLSADEAYANTVSKIYRRFLRALPVSGV